MPHLGTLWSTDHAVLSQSQKLAKSPRRFPLVEIFIRRIPGSGKGAIGNARKECNHRRHDPCCRLCWGLNGDRVVEAFEGLILTAGAALLVVTMLGLPDRA